MPGLNLDRVGSDRGYDLEVDQALRTLLASIPVIAQAVIHLPPGPLANQDVDTTPGWTNAILNRMIRWASEPGWSINGQNLALCAQPEAYRLNPVTGRNTHDPEYLWDLTLREASPAAENGWADWVADPAREAYRGVLVAVESEWGGIDAMADDFCKLLDCPAPLRIFVHGLPTNRTSARLIQSVFQAQVADHRHRPPILCLGFANTTWAQAQASGGPTIYWAR